MVYSTHTTGDPSAQPPSADFDEIRTEKIRITKNPDLGQTQMV